MEIMKTGVEFLLKKDQDLRPVIGAHTKAVVALLSYIPGIALIVGVARIIFASYGLVTIDNKDRKKEFGKHIVRGLVECLQFTVILALIDLVAVVRARTKVMPDTSKTI